MDHLFSKLQYSWFYPHQFSLVHFQYLFPLRASSMIALRTADGTVVHITEELAAKSTFLKNLMQETQLTAPVDVLFTSDVFDHVHRFMLTDNHVLEPDYNPLEIYFSGDVLNFFDEIDGEMLLKICSAANYLDYPFLLETTCKVLAGRLAENTRGELAQIIKGQEVKSKVPAIEGEREEFEWYDEQL